MVDRTKGKEFCQEFDHACTKYSEYVRGIEKEISERNDLIELIEQSELYYDAQYGEAKIVANVRVSKHSLKLICASYINNACILGIQKFCESRAHNVKEAGAEETVVT